VAYGPAEASIHAVEDRPYGQGAQDLIDQRDRKMAAQRSAVATPQPGGNDQPHVGPVNETAGGMQGRESDKTSPLTGGPKMSSAEQDLQKQKQADEDPANPFRHGTVQRLATDVAFGPLDWFANKIANPLVAAPTIAADYVLGNGPIAQRYGYYLKQGYAPWDAMNMARTDLGKALQVLAETENNDPFFGGADRVVAQFGRVAGLAQDLSNPAWGGFGAAGKVTGLRGLGRGGGGGGARPGCSSASRRRRRSTSARPD
jgi:hypothetical protein